MNGRRAKQRRRMVIMADLGDEFAQWWCAAYLTRSQRERLSQRMTVCRGRQAK